MWISGKNADTSSAPVRSTSLEETADVIRSFDDITRPSQQRLRDGETEAVYGGMVGLGVRQALASTVIPTPSSPPPPSPASASCPCRGTSRIPQTPVRIGIVKVNVEPAPTWLS